MRVNHRRASVDADGAWSLIDEIKAHRGLMRTDDLARVFGVSRQAICRRIKRGDIPAIQGTTDVDPKTLVVFLLKKNPWLRESDRS